MEDLGSLLQVLINNEIEFVVVGGFAAVLHGSNYVTQDVDICAPVSEEYFKKIRDHFSAYHPVHRMTPQKLSFLEIPTDLKTLKNLYLKTDLGVLDILGEVAGLGNFDEVMNHSVEIELYGKKCKVLSIDALIKAKNAMARPKDHLVVQELKLIKAENEEFNSSK